jgi:endoglucanase
LRKFAHSWATIALASSAFLCACGGGGGGTSAGSASTGETVVGGFSAEADLSPATAFAPSTSPSAAGASPTPPSQTASDTIFTPDASGLGYPFASRKKAYVAGIRPTSATQTAQDALIRNQYDYWKTGVEARCGGYVVKFNDAYATVSEGAGYGMLLSVVMAGYDKDAKNLFDGLFRVARSKTAYGYNEPALMEWRINADCSSGGGGWNATDGDLDIAMALLMADRQWGSAGVVDYKKEALATIAAIKRRNMQDQGFTGTGPVKVSRTSDYMIGHFKAFKRASGDAFWDLAVTKSFELLNLMQSKFAPNTGLIPDFIVYTDTDPIPSPGGFGDGNDLEDDYAFNACRIPWRLATDYVTTGDERSKAVTVKLTDFFNRTTGGNPANFSGGYTLSGTPMIPNSPWPVFIGPATAGAMVDGKFQPFLNSLWTFSSNNLSRDYYNNELQLLSLIVATGNWWNP